MVTLFSSPVCTPCRKAIKWLQENDIPYRERNIFADSLSENEFKQILTMSQNGIEGIISIHSKLFRELDIKLESLSLHELYKIIERYPRILRRPILIDNKNLQIGYNEEAIRRFLPRAIRKSNLEELLKMMNE